MAKKHLYVIGKISGCENNNLSEFKKAKEQLEKAGFKVTIPQNIINKETSWQLAMRKSLTFILSVDKNQEPVIDGIAELPGIYGSRGARCESGVCQQLSIPHKPVSEWIK